MSDQLKRQLGLWDAIAIFVGIILGSGIFVAPSAVAGAAPGKLSSILLWVLTGAVAACGAFCYAECGARLPRTGGFYVFYREVHGEAVAFVGGWVALVMTYPASIAAIAEIFSRYLGEAFPVLPVGDHFLAAGAVVIAGVLNAVGVRSGAWTQRLFTGVKVAALAILCLAALMAPGRPPGAGEGVGPLTLAGDLSVVLGALILVLWTYDGWSDVTLVAGEVRDPGRSIGRAVVLGTFVLVAIYALVQLSVMSILDPSEAATSGRVVADAVETSLGGWAGRGVALLIVVSTFGSINGIVLTTSRLGYAMARDGVFLRWFGQVHPTWGTPARSLGVLIAASLAYTLLGFDTLLKLFSFSVWIFYGLTAVAMVVLRVRGVGEPVQWRAPGGWLAPGLVLLTGAAVTLGLAYEDPATAVKGFLLLAAGFPVYVVWRWVRAS